MYARKTNITQICFKSLQIRQNSNQFHKFFKQKAAANTIKWLVVTNYFNTHDSIEWLNALDYDTFLVYVQVTASDSDSELH